MPRFSPRTIKLWTTSYKASSFSSTVFQNFCLLMHPFQFHRFSRFKVKKHKNVCVLVNKKTLTGSNKFIQWWEVPLPLKPNEGKCLFSESRLLKVLFFCTISVRVNINGVTSPIEQSRHAPLPAPFLWIVKSGNGTQWLVHIVGKWYWVKQFTAWHTPYTGHGILSSWKTKQQC